MLVIFGMSRRVRRLGVVQRGCGACGQVAAHPLERTRNWFTLFFVPLVPLSTRYTTRCAFCAAECRVPADEAHRLAAA